MDTHSNLFQPWPNTMIILMEIKFCIKHLDIHVVTNSHNPQQSQDGMPLTSFNSQPEAWQISRSSSLSMALTLPSIHSYGESWRSPITNTLTDAGIAIQLPPLQRRALIDPVPLLGTPSQPTIPTAQSKFNFVISKPGPDGFEVPRTSRGRKRKDPTPDNHGRSAESIQAAEAVRKLFTHTLLKTGSPTLSNEIIDQMNKEDQNSLLHVCNQIIIPKNTGDL